MDINFPLILVIAVMVTGAVIVIDNLFFRKQRLAALEPSEGEEKKPADPPLVDFSFEDDSRESEKPAALVWPPPPNFTAIEATSVVPALDRRLK